MENHIPLSLGQPGVQTSQAAHAPGVPPVHIGTQREGAPAIGAIMNINAASATASTTAAITVPSNRAIEASLVCDPLPSHIVMSIRTSFPAHYLSSHPDIGLVTYLTHWFQHGFDLMFVGPITSTSPRNLRSTDEFHEVVTHALHSELLLGHTSGPFRSPPFPRCHCSPLGAILKPSGKICLILDLSQPRGTSVNKYILEEFCSVRYSVFDNAIKLARLAGESAMMAKIDIKYAFRLCPVRMVDRHKFVHKAYTWTSQYTGRSSFIRQ